MPTITSRIKYISIITIVLYFLHWYISDLIQRSAANAILISIADIHLNERIKCICN